MFWWGLLRMSLTIYPLLLRITQAVHPVATLANIEREGLLQKTFICLSYFNPL
jgi:hypothetical protein